MMGHPVLSEAERDAWESYLDMREALDRVLETRMRADSDISTPEFRVLGALHAAHDRALRTGELAAVLCWERSRISHLARRMEGRGLIERTECPDDGRGTWLVLTNPGRRALLRAVRGHTELLREVLFEPLGDDGLATLGDISRRVGAAIKAQRGAESDSADTDAVPA